MKVINHWLDGATRITYPAGPKMAVRRLAVAHFTAGATAMSSIDFWKTPAAMGAEAHVVIDRDGTIYQIRAFDERADHAGDSKWTDPKTGKAYRFLNSCSIGVEFANGGENEKLSSRWSRLTPVRAAHKNGGPVKNWEAYPAVQIVSGIAVFQAVVERYHLDDVVGHDDVAPRRKSDPGPAFPMQRLREACGFRGMPVVAW